MLALVNLLVVVLLLAMFFGAAVWFLNWINLPEPFAMIARVIVALIALWVILNLLLGWHPLPVLVH